jgi:hypothetical protein
MGIDFAFPSGYDALAVGSDSHAHCGSRDRSAPNDEFGTHDVQEGGNLMIQTPNTRAPRQAHVSAAFHNLKSPQLGVITA